MTSPTGPVSVMIEQFGGSEHWFTSALGKFRRKMPKRMLVTGATDVAWHGCYKANLASETRSQPSRFLQITPRNLLTINCAEYIHVRFRSGASQMWAGPYSAAGIMQDFGSR